MMSRIGDESIAARVGSRSAVETTNQDILVGAPAFVRGEERFSAREEASTLIARFSAGNALRIQSPPGA
jgi:hypothetical protein